jgi:hypothetical protein
LHGNEGLRPAARPAVVNRCPILGPGARRARLVPALDRRIPPFTLAPSNRREVLRCKVVATKSPSSMGR